MRILVFLLLPLLPLPSSSLPTLGPGGGRRWKRQVAQEPDFKQGCTTTGYEKRFRELCEEEFEEVCKTVTEVEYKKEIITRCDTRLEQRCNTTTRAVPKEVCVERNRTECFPDIRVVPDVTFTVECENIVQHICEEHYQVPDHHHPRHHPLIGPHPNPHPFGKRRRKRQSGEEGDKRKRQTEEGEKRKRQTEGGRRRKKRQSPVLNNQILLQQLKSALQVPPPPLVHHHEVPAPPGCRSIVTQQCHKVAVPVIKKLPDEQCQEVPGVKCYLELVDVEEPQCFEVPVEDCKDELRETPFLVDVEECEDVPRLICTEIEEQVPIQVCKTVDVLRTPIVISKGSSRTTSVSGLGVRARVVGKLPEIGDVGGGRKAKSARLRQDDALEKLRSQIFDDVDTEPRSRREKSVRGQKMRQLLKEFLSEI